MSTVKLFSIIFIFLFTDPLIAQEKSNNDSIDDFSDKITSGYFKEHIEKISGVEKVNRYTISSGYSKPISFKRILIEVKSSGDQNWFRNEIISLLDELAKGSNIEVLAADKSSPPSSFSWLASVGGDFIKVDCCVTLAKQGVFEGSIFITKIKQD
jgi:hypothetical protein